MRTSLTTSQQGRIPSTTPFESDRGYDRTGNFSTWDARAESYTFDVHNRLTGHVVSGSRTEDSITVGGNYTAQSGTWSVANGVLTETSAATGRIFRAFPATNTEFTFSYRSPHGPGDTSDYDPERYGLALLRATEPGTAGEYDFVALVIEPTGLFIREWSNTTLLGELGASALPSDADTWYDVKVEYSGANKTGLTVSRAKRGDPFDVVFSGVTVSLAEDASQEIGFGVGQLGDYAFKDVIFRDPTDTSETVQAAYLYDALGRRIAKIMDPDGAPETTEYYYDGPRVVEERVSGAVTATYVYGLYVDEVLEMQRDTGGSAGLDPHFFHQDDLFNVVALTDGSGTPIEHYDYGEFGQPSFFDGTGTPIGATAYGNDYLFNGRRHDPETGLYDYRTLCGVLRYHCREPA